VPGVCGYDSAASPRSCRDEALRSLCAAGGLVPGLDRVVTRRRIWVRRGAALGVAGALAAVAGASFGSGADGSSTADERAEARASRATPTPTGPTGPKLGQSVTWIFLRVEGADRTLVVQPAPPTNTSCAAAFKASASEHPSSVTVTVRRLPCNGEITADYRFAEPVRVALKRPLAGRQVIGAKRVSRLGATAPRP
jgi:hypothetical protein